MKLVWFGALCLAFTAAVSAMDRERLVKIKEERLWKWRNDPDHATFTEEQKLMFNLLQASAFTDVEADDDDSEDIPVDGEVVVPHADPDLSEADDEEGGDMAVPVGTQGRRQKRSHLSPRTSSRVQSRPWQSRTFWQPTRRVVQQPTVVRQPSRTAQRPTVRQPTRVVVRRPTVRQVWRPATVQRQPARTPARRPAWQPPTRQQPMRQQPVMRQPQRQPTVRQPTRQQQPRQPRTNVFNVMQNTQQAVAELRRMESMLSTGRLPAQPRPRIRKEYRCLSADERQRFHFAINRLKNTPVGNTNVYDTFALAHHNSTSPFAHDGVAFPGWHRHFLVLFEEALRQVDPTITLPYLDTRYENYYPNLRASPIWTDGYLGTPQGNVVRGPFAFWREPRTNTALNRQCSYDRELLFDDAALQNTLAIPDFSRFCTELELVHGAFHSYVDGHMNELNFAAADPAFFLHHAFIDLLWEEWREQHQYRTGRDPERDYPNIGGGHGRNSPMLPFSANNAFGTRRFYTQVYYNYSPRYTCPGVTCGNGQTRCGYGGNVPTGFQRFIRG